MSSELCERHHRLVAAALYVAALALYAPAVGHEFVTIDDHTYVVANQFVRGGFSAEGVRRALLGGFDWNWHPITWLSHMLDGELYGVTAAGHHLTNLLLHAANVALVFHVLRRLTKAALPSALVAILFAAHPAHVEVVAWVSARKDLVSMFFGLLSVLAYLRHAEHPTRGRYVALLATYSAALLSKSMLVTLPLLLLLFDYWPLERLSYRSIREKVPLLMLALTVGIVTIVEQRNLGALNQIAQLGIGKRVANGVVSYVEYLRTLAWPTGLGVMYVHPDAPAGTPLAPGRIAAATVILVGVTALIIRSKRRFALVGWLWWLGSAAPIIGVLQVGPQARADRYTYFTYIGLYVILAWTFAAALATARRVRAVAACCTAVIVVALAFRTREQLATWQTSRTLYEQAVEVDPNNVYMRYSLAKALDMDGHFEEAERQLRRCLAFEPNNAEMLDRLGVVLASQDRLAEAIGAFRAAVRLSPRNSMLRHNLAVAYHRSGDDPAACHEWRSLVSFDPGYTKAIAKLREVCRQF